MDKLAPEPCARQEQLLSRGLQHIARKSLRPNGRCLIQASLRWRRPIISYCGFPARIRPSTAQFHPAFAENCRFEREKSALAKDSGESTRKLTCSTLNRVSFIRDPSCALLSITEPLDAVHAMSPPQQIDKTAGAPAIAGDCAQLALARRSHSSRGGIRDHDGRSRPKCCGRNRIRYPSQRSSASRAAQAALQTRWIR